jgi:hypothetical protein
MHGSIKLQELNHSGDYPRIFLTYSILKTHYTSQPLKVVLSAVALHQTDFLRAKEETAILLEIN